MPKVAGRVLMGACLLIVPGHVAPAFAQSGRLWVDPPARITTPQPLAATSRLPESSAARDEQPWPDEAARRRSSSVQAAQSSALPATVSEASRAATEMAASPTGDPPNRADRSDGAQADFAVAAVPAAGGAAKLKEDEATELSAAAESSGRGETRAERRSRKATRSVRLKRPERRVVAERSSGARSRAARYADFRIMRLHTPEFGHGRSIDGMTEPSRQFVDFPIR